MGVIIIREMVGTSPRSWSDAARQAVATASKTVRNIQNVEVVKSTAVVADGEIVEYRVEINGRNVYRSGTVAEKGQNLFPEDGDFFPCMIAAEVRVEPGDSGGAVLVRGIPAGVTSRSFGGWLGFTPLAEGLAELGLDLCTTPDCGLAPPSAD